MLLHRVEGIRIEHQDFADADQRHDTFSAHTATFFSEGAAFAVVTFYTALGEALLVNGADVWGVVGKDRCPNVQHDVHLRDGLAVKFILSGGVNWIHQFYVGLDCQLSLACREKLDFAVKQAVAV